MKKVSRYTILFFIVTLTVLFSACNGKEPASNIDFKNYITLSVEGNEGNGILKYSIAKDKLESDIKQILGNPNAEISGFISGVDVNLSKYDSLSNGESVTATVVYDQDIADKMGISFLNTSFSYEVESLENLEVIDPFQNLTITYDGAAPCAMVKLEYADDGLLDSACFKVVSNDDAESKVFVDVGDRFCVKLAITEEELAKRGCKVSKTEQEYTVNASDLSSYAKSVSDVKRETLDSIKNSVKQMLQEQFGESLVDISYKGCQMAYINDVNSYAKQVGYTDGFPESANHLILAYEITFKKGKNKTTWYTAVEVENILNDASEMQTYTMPERNYAKGDYSYVTMNGLMLGLHRYSTFFDLSYSVELQK